MLRGDESCRQTRLADDEFDDLGQELASTGAEHGALLTRGHVSPVLPALSTMLYLPGFDAPLDEEDLRRGNLSLASHRRVRPRPAVAAAGCPGRRAASRASGRTRG
ncbi:MAG TPA: hypothetical protein PKB14_15765 [Rubrivivax sp.]|nr:hypothetical protein [Rubrivivax sp.]